MNRETFGRDLNLDLVLDLDKNHGPIKLMIFIKCSFYMSVFAERVNLRQVVNNCTDIFGSNFKQTD